MAITARYPQNRGLADLANRLGALNASRGPATPYQPSMGAGGIEGYAAGLAGGGGLMNNQQAQQNYSTSGYMPRTTVGGGFGTYNPAPYGQPRSAFSMAHPGSYGAGLAGYTNNNRGGSLYGGATPGMVAGRPAWMAPPAQQGPTDFNLAGSALAGRYTRNAQGAITPISPGVAGGLAAPHYAVMTGADGRRYRVNPGTVAYGRLAAMPENAGIGAAAAAPTALGLADPALYGGAAESRPTGTVPPLGLAAYAAGGAPSERYQQWQQARDYRKANYYGLRQQAQQDARQAAMEAADPTGYGLAAMGLRMQQGMEQGRLGLAQQQLTQQGALAREGFQNRRDLAQLEHQNALAMQQGQQQGAKDLLGLQNQGQLARDAQQQAAATGLAGLAHQNALAQIEARNKGQVAAIEAGRDPNQRLRTVIEAAGGLAKIAETQPQLAAALAPMLDALGGGGQQPAGQGLAQYFNGGAQGPVAAQRGLAAGGNQVLNDAIASIGNNSSAGNVVETLQRLEAQGHITPQNRKQVATMVMSQMHPRMLQYLPDAEGEHAAFLRRFLGVRQNPKSVNNNWAMPDSIPY